MDKLPVNVKKPHNQDLCSMCQKLGRKCTGLVEEDISDDEKTKLDEPIHRVIRKDGMEFKVRGFAGVQDRGGFSDGFGGGDQKIDEAEGILVVDGIPYGTSEEEVRNFLQKNIPNTDYVRVPLIRDTNKIEGLAFVQLLSHSNVANVLVQIRGLRMDGRILTINEWNPTKAEFLSRGFRIGLVGPGRGGFTGSARGGRGRYLGRGGFGGRTDRSGFGNIETECNDDAFLLVRGLPLDISKEDIKEFLLDEIPPAEDVRVRPGIGENRAWVRLKSGTSVHSVIRQVMKQFDDLKEFNDGILRINQSKITLDIFETIGEAEDHKTGSGDRSGRNFDSDSTDSDASIDNLDVRFSGIGVSDRKPQYVHQNSRSARINSVSSARSLRTNSVSGFGRDVIGNFVGDRDGNGDITIDSDITIFSSNSSDYEADKDPERYHW